MAFAILISVQYWKSAPMPRVASVHLYPVKSLHRVSTPFLQLDPWGAQGDRRWLVAAPDGTFLTQRSVPKMATIHVSPEDDGIILSTPDAPDLHVPFPGKDAEERRVRLWTPDEVPACDAGEKAAAWLTQILETPCGLVFMDRPENARPSGFGPVSFADEFPLLITTAESLADLNTRLETPVPMERFRPNIVVEGVDAWSEDGWARLRIGETVLAIPKPCARCGVTMVDQENGTIPVPKEPLQTLAEFRHQPAGVIFGQNATVETAGRIAPGDEVEILERSD